jgi:ribonuclease HI
LENGKEETLKQKISEAFIDGSGKGFYGYMLDGKSRILCENTPGTNNQNEWMGLYILLLDLPDKTKIKVYSDSQLVVNQFNEKWIIKSPYLQTCFSMCKVLVKIKEIDMDLVWVPRELNLFGKKLEKELRKLKRHEENNIC